MDYFYRKKSYSGEYYYINKITGKTQWGFNTYFKTNKKLPTGWVRLNLDGKPVYKYNKPVLPSYYSYDYSPREFDIFQLSYEDLDLLNEEEEEEAYRRYNLFQKVARFLKVTPESICDESLEFFARKANIPLQRIITYINETESKKLGKRAILTLFSTIKRTDSSFSSKRSIRELCGVNTRKVEAQNAFFQIEHQFSCPLSLYPFIDPVTCSSGHTFEREYVTQLIRSSNPVCPLTKLRLTGLISPNHALKKVIDQFVEKYINQKGEHWAPILEFCVAYIEGREKRLKDPIDVTRREPEHEHVVAVRTAVFDRGGPPLPGERPVNYETGRNPDEIRAFLIENGYDLDIIDNIPEVVAHSSNSSYNHALGEANRRIEDPVYRENHRSRTAEELLEYYTRLTPQYAEDLRTPEAYDAALQTANSPYNSYARAWRSRIGGQWFLNSD